MRLALVWRLRSTPDVSRQVAYQRELFFLYVVRDGIAAVHARKAALRAHGQPVEGDELDRVVEALAQRGLVLELRLLGRDEAEHHRLLLGHEAQWREGTGARAIVFQEIERDLERIEQPVRDRLVAPFRVPAAAAVSPAKMHPDVQAFRRGTQDLVGHIDIPVDQRVPIIPARRKPRLHVGVPELGERCFVDLHIAAARLRQGVELLDEGFHDVGPECVEIVVGGGGDRRIATTEMQRARTRDGDLRQELRVRLEKAHVVGVDRMRPPDPTADLRLRLRPATRRTRFRRDGVNVQLAELLVEKAVIGAAAKLAVGHELEAELLLQPDGFPDGEIFRLGELGLADLTARKSRALAQQRIRSQQAADMLGAKRWLCRRRDARVNIHRWTSSQRRCCDRRDGDRPFAAV